MPDHNYVLWTNNIILFLTLAVTVYGMVFVRSIKKHQDDAAYGFYSNLQVYLEQIALLIKNKSSDDVDEWLKVLGMSDNDRNKTEHLTYKNKAIEVARFAKKFVDFLAMASNQVPPVRKNKDSVVWEKQFEIMRTALIHIAYHEEIGICVGWTDSKYPKTSKEFVEAIDGIADSIKRYKDSRMSFWGELFNSAKRCSTSFQENTILSLNKLIATTKKYYKDSIRDKLFHPKVKTD
ncbi:MAG: hypothetical protein LBP75_01755 [Planctomycetota bacterium]|nr:hypothetical protein [Planctomycetota bacterium]